MSARLKSLSKDTVEGPVKVRVATPESEVGVPQILNVDNGEHGAGAVWDFSARIAGMPLGPMKLSKAKTLHFPVERSAPIASGQGLQPTIFNMETHI
jgi:hypothetical protein